MIQSAASVNRNSRKPETWKPPAFSSWWQRHCSPPAAHSQAFPYILPLMGQNLRKFGFKLVAPQSQGVWIGHSPLCNQGALIMSKRILSSQENGLYVGFSKREVVFYREGKEVVSVRLDNDLNELSDNSELDKTVDRFLKTGIFDYRGVMILWIRFKI